MKIFPSSSIKKLDAYTIENEPIASIDLIGTCSNRINKSHHRTDGIRKHRSLSLPDRGIMAETLSP